MKTSTLFPPFPLGRTQAAGSSWVIGMALAVIVAWAITGPLFDYSESWLLVINAATIIATLLMVLLVEHAQKRDAEATQRKLDQLIQLIRTQKGARNNLMDIDDLSDAALSRLKQEFARSQRPENQQGELALHEAVPMAARAPRRQKQFDECARRLHGQQQWT